MRLKGGFSLKKGVALSDEAKSESHKYSSLKWPQINFGVKKLYIEVVNP